MSYYISETTSDMTDIRGLDVSNITMDLDDDPPIFVSTRGDTRIASNEDRTFLKPEPEIGGARPKDRPITPSTHRLRGVGSDHTLRPYSSCHSLLVSDASRESFVVDSAPESDIEQSPSVLTGLSA